MTKRRSRSWRVRGEGKSREEYIKESLGWSEIFRGEFPLSIYWHLLQPSLLFRVCEMLLGRFRRQGIASGTGRMGLRGEWMAKFEKKTREKYIYGKRVVKNRAHGEYRSKSKECSDAEHMKRRKERRYSPFANSLPMKKNIVPPSWWELSQFLIHFFTLHGHIL